MNLFKRAICKIALALAWPCEVAGSLLILELNFSFFFIIYGTAAAVAGVDSRITDFLELGEGTPVERLDLLITWGAALVAFQLLQVAVWALTSIDRALGGKQRRLYPVWLWQPWLDSKGRSDVKAHSYLDTDHQRHTAQAVDCYDVYSPRRSKLHALLRIVTVVPAYIVLTVVELAILVPRAFAWIETATAGRISTLTFKALALGISFEGRFNAYYFMLTDKYPPLRKSSIERYPYRIVVNGPPPRFNRLGVLLRPVIGLRSYVIYQLYSLWLELLSMPVLISVIFRGRVPKRLFNEQSRSELFSLRSNAYFSFITDTVPMPGRGWP